MMVPAPLRPRVVLSGDVLTADNFAEYTRQDGPGGEKPRADERQISHRKPPPVSRLRATTTDTPPDQGVL